MDSKIIQSIQKYLEYIRYNTLDFGVRLIKPFVVYDYIFSKGKYKVVFDKNNLNDCYWVTKKELDDFNEGKYSNKVNLKMDRPFEEDGKSGFYLSFSQNNLSPTMENIQRLFGIRFQKNDIFYKIIDVSFLENKNAFLNTDLSNPSIKDNVKIFTMEDFHVDDFIEVNKFVNIGRTVKRGDGYSMEIDHSEDNEYLSIGDVRKAISLSKEEVKKEILNDIEIIFPDGHKIGDFIRNVISNRLS